VKDITKNDHLLLSIPRINVRKYWLVGKGKFSEIDGVGKGYPTKNSIEYIPITNELARFWGYYLAEGWTHGKREIELAFHQDEVNLINDVCSIVRNIFKCNPTFRYNNNSKVKVIRFYHSGLARTLDRDFGHGANNKFIPYWILGLTDERLRHLLNGYFYGDGCVAPNYNNAVAKTVSKNLAYTIKHMFVKTGVVPNIRHCDKGQCYSKKYDRTLKHSEHWIIDVGCEKFFGLDLNSKPRCHSDDCFIYLPIKEIENTTFDGNVYDITTESKTFSTNGFLSHNCGWQDDIQNIIKKSK